MYLNFKRHIASGVLLLLLFAVINMLLYVTPASFAEQRADHGSITAVEPIGPTDSYLTILPEESAKLLSELQLRLSARLSRHNDILCLDALKQVGLSKIADCAATTIVSICKTDHLHRSNHTLYYVYTLRRIII